MESTLDGVLAGAVATGSLFVGLIFFRFWKQTGDLFFLCFAWSFWIEAVNRVALAWQPETGEISPLYYGVRLLSYGLILLAIWLKNRPKP